MHQLHHFLDIAGADDTTMLSEAFAPSFVLFFVESRFGDGGVKPAALGALFWRRRRRHRKRRDADAAGGGSGGGCGRRRSIPRADPVSADPI